jgi:hypothetical protein
VVTSRYEWVGPRYRDFHVGHGFHDSAGIIIQSLVFGTILKSDDEDIASRNGYQYLQKFKSFRHETEDTIREGESGQTSDCAGCFGWLITGNKNSSTNWIFVGIKISSPATLK